MTNDKMQELRIEMANKSLADVSAIIQDFDRQTGRHTSVRGGGVFAREVTIRYDWRVKTKDVEVKFDIDKDLDSEAVELAWDIEATWNRWMRVLNLLEEEQDEAWDACRASDWADDDTEFCEVIDEAIDRCTSMALSDTADVMKRWLESAEDLPWDLSDEEVLEYMCYEA